MYCSGKPLLFLALAWVLLAHLCSQSEAASNFDCCLRYTQRVLPFRAIASFTRQKAGEVCDINAIVFYTKKKTAVCADPKQDWVKKAMNLPRLKNKKM